MLLRSEIPTSRSPIARDALISRETNMQVIHLVSQLVVLLLSRMYILICIYLFICVMKNVIVLDEAAWCSVDHIRSLKETLTNSSGSGFRVLTLSRLYDTRFMRAVCHASSEIRP